MARLAVICFLFVLCTLARSTPRNRIISRSDHSTVVLSTHNPSVTYRIEGETEKVNQFINAVQEGRRHLDDYPSDVEVSRKFTPWCGSEGLEPHEETHEPRGIQD